MLVSRHTSNRITSIISLTPLYQVPSWWLKPLKQPSAFFHKCINQRINMAGTPTIDFPTTNAASASDDGPSSASNLPTDKVRAMIDACANGNLPLIQQLVQEDTLYCSQQDKETGMSPLMAASKVGNLALVQELLNAGAPWNAIDRAGQCAGNYATDAECWDVVNLLVEWGTRAELILGEIQRTQRRQQNQQQIPTTPTTPAVSITNASDNTQSTNLYEQPSTKPDYLQHRLRYNLDGTALLDADDDAVMMEWERPIMKAHASIMLEEPHKRVLNVGFGMGIIDTALQELQPSHHYIIEAHPDVYDKLCKDGWNTKPGVQVLFGRWQDIVPKMVHEGVQVDAIFFDTYAEHGYDMEDFHQQVPALLSKPQGVYSFFNGLAPDNLFFHGVACQVIKLQLSTLGLDTEFLQCEIQVNDDSVWEGVRRKYWHNRDVYYLPRVTWNNEYLGRKTKAEQGTSDHVAPSSNEILDTEQASGGDTKRQRRQD
jgi:protein arginine N-methyltransferase 2